MKRMKWTPEADARLRQMGFGRWDVDDIAAYFDTTRGAIQVRMSTIGVKNSFKVEDAIRDRIVQLASQGWKHSRIATHLKIAPEIVEHHASAAEADNS